MRTIRAQKGIAVMLMSLLVGISTIAVTVTVAYSHSTKKESNVAGHAQINSQMLAWSGVSTFRKYLVDKGANDFDEIKALPSSISLKDEQGKKVSANNIRIIGCADITDNCQVEADISAESGASQSALTINIVFDVKLNTKNKLVKPQGGANFGGGLILDGKLGAEVPNSKVTLNVDGDLIINTGARFENIAELNINNCNGDVTIYCSLIASDSFCAIPKINVTSCGNISITDLDQKGNFGDLYAKKSVHLSGAIAENVYSLQPPATSDSSLSIEDLTEFLGIGGVDIASGSKVGNVYSMGTVVVHTASSAGNIYTDGRAIIKGISSKAGNIIANGDVELWLGGEAKDIKAGGKVDIHTASKAQDISANGRVYVGGIGAKAKNVRSKAHVEVHTGANVDSIVSKGYVSLTGAGVAVYGDVVSAGGSYLGGAVYTAFYPSISGSIYAIGEIVFSESSLIAGSIGGQVYATGKVRDGLSTPIAWLSSKFHDGKADVVNAKVTVQEWPPVSPLDAVSMEDKIEKEIEDRTKDIKSYVSVQPYKSEANYIFDKSSGTKRVYLNKLTNLATGEVYRTDVDAGLQYVRSGDSESLLAGTGAPYYLGKYTLAGQVYIGAICATADNNGYCSSEIIGYLPRIGLQESPNVDGGLFTGIAAGVVNLFTGSSNADYEYVGNSRYIASSVSERSNINNAVLAPGIMYFDDDLVVRGRGISAATGADDSAFVNTFLAEGDIDVSAFSPNIYSPYNVTRAADVADVCNRSLKNMSDTLVSASASTPAAASDKYLRATNLCKSATQFANNMNINSANNTITTVKIDGIDVPKLDLGYVGLMSEKSIHLQFCTQIYGDVLAKGAIHSSTELICGGGQRQTVTGSMTSQTGSTGHSGLLGALTNTNKIMLGASFIVAKEEYSNFNNNGQPVQGPAETLVIDADGVTVKWFRIK